MSLTSHRQFRFVVGTTLLLGALLSTSPVSAATVSPVKTRSRIVTIPPTPTTSNAPDAAAWIVVDAETGVVLDSKNPHEALPPASITKLLTALTVVANLAPDATVPVSQKAANMPARKISMQAGDVWDQNQALHALLMSSANDAAMALAEATSGNVDAFRAAMSTEANKLGLQDDPIWNDPAGLDDDSSVDGGNRVSVRDMAIISRAVLSEPRLSKIVSTDIYSFKGPRGESHRLVNHNRLLTQYSGTIGLKTGYTEKAKQCLAAAAERNGRTIIAVLEGGNDPWTLGERLLDLGFATSSISTSHAEVLPAVHVPEYQSVEFTTLSHVVAKRVHHAISLSLQLVSTFAVALAAMRSRAVFVTEWRRRRIFRRAKTEATWRRSEPLI